MSNQKERVSAFLSDTDDGEFIDFGEEGVPNARIFAPSIRDMRKARELAGDSATVDEIGVALLVVCTVDDKTRQPYFSAEHYQQLLEAKGDVKRRISKLDAAAGKVMAPNR